MTAPVLPPLQSNSQIQAEVNGALGLITLNRPEVLNALSLPMVRDLTSVLTHWADHPSVHAVVLMGQHDASHAAAFCAGGDVHFFQHAAEAQDPGLQAFFTELFALHHLIHRYDKPCIALMDGIAMGSGLALAQGAKLRVVNERSVLGTPDARMGLFPDVSGTWFLGQLPGHTGEWLALTGQSLGAGDALELGLADVFVPAAEWGGLLQALRSAPQPHAEHVVATVMERVDLAPEPQHVPSSHLIERHFGAADVASIMASLTVASDPAWCLPALQRMQASSPLMMAVSLALVRQARHLTLGGALRLERNATWHGFASAAQGVHNEALEGMRANHVDPGQRLVGQPRWQPSAVDGISPQEVSSFLTSPWAIVAHPLRALD